MIRKRTSLLSASLLAVLLALWTPVPAQAQLGVAGGLNFESADDIQAGNAQANLESSTGYHVGLVYELSLGPLNIRPGVFYRRVGEFNLSDVSGGLQETTYTVSAWEAPLDLRVALFPTPVVSPYLVGGPKITIPRGEGNFGDATTDLSYTLNIGLGAEISLPGSSLRLQPELLYEFGATGFIDDGQTVDLPGQNNSSVTFTPQDSPSFSTFALRLNVLL